jgi:glucose/mannose-6-phosphate isomerase
MTSLDYEIVQSELQLSDLAERYDNSNMHKVIERLPNQIEISLTDTIPLLPKGPFRKVFINGLGGSAFPVDVVVDAFRNKLRSNVQLTRNYEFPTALNKNDLFIASSFSGNTEEVLSAISPFPANAKNVIIISAGGKLAALANERNYPLVRIPKEKEPAGFQPRSALGYFVTYFARILFDTGILDDPREELETVPTFLRQTEIRTEAEKTAVWLKDRIPVIYTDESHLLSVARVTKIKFNENSKRPAFFNALPEANHNELIGFSKSIGKYGLLYFHDPISKPQIELRFDVMKRVFEREGLDHLSFHKWEMPGKIQIQRIFAALMFADWCSYTLALIDGIDPTPVGLVESFKNELEST